MLTETDNKLHQTSIYIYLAKRLDLLEQFLSGKTIPKFSLNNPDGKQVSIDDFKGKYLLIDFWASWCPSCRLENPFIVRIYDRYKSKGFEILGVSFDTKMNAWLEAIEVDNLKWTHVSDLQGWNSEPAKMFGIISIPSSILIDGNGIIVANNPSSSELEKILENILQ
jgi:thiol-disulfide isomerase/thioredoxin